MITIKPSSLPRCVVRKQCQSVCNGSSSSSINMLMMIVALWMVIGCSDIVLFVECRAILGVDLGSLYMKVALVQSGSPLEIVTNLHSKRKTEQLILFDNDARYYGADAAALLARKSHLTPAAMSLMLGRDEQHPNVMVLAERHYPIRPEFNETRSGVCLSVDGQIFTPEELVAMVLSHAVDISVAYSLESGTNPIAPPRDVVLTVSSFATQRERQALLDAALLADLNVLTLIDETTAAALHFAMDKNFANEKEQILLFYNMGGSSLQVTLVRFFNYDQPQKYGPAKSTPALEVLGKTWDSTLGGDAIDHIIVEMICNHFNGLWQKQSGDSTKDVRTIPRAMMKIRLQANKVKHVLSANNIIPVHLDSVHDDISMQMTITREELEEQMVSSGMIQRAIQPVLDVLKMANKTANDINGTELLGGAMRVPKIQAELQKALYHDKPDEQLGLHINSDESFALGAAFAGANISTAFRVRQVGMIDINPFPIQVTLSDMINNGTDKDGGSGFFGIGGGSKKKENADAAADAAPTTPWTKQAVIFKPYGKINIKKMIAFTHDQDVECSLDYVAPTATSDTPILSTSSLPPGTESALERYEIKGIVDFVKEMTDKKLLNATNPKPKVSLQFELSSSGIASLIRAEATVEEYYIAQEEIYVDDDSEEVDDSNSTTTNATTTADATDVDDAKNGTDTINATETNSTENKTTTKPSPKKKKKKQKKITVEKDSIFGIRKPKTAFISQEKKRVHKKTLDVQVFYNSRVQPHTPELFAASKAKLLAMAQRDKDRMMLQEAKNKVESYIYKIKNKLTDDEDTIASVTTEEQRDTVKKLADDAEEWLYDDGYNADLPTMEKKYDELAVPFEKILLRISEKTALPAAKKALEKKLVEMESIVADWVVNKTYISETERDLVTKQIADVRAWVIEKDVQQSLVQPSDEPVFVSTEIPTRTTLLETLIMSLNKKPKPKPPKVKKNKTDKNNTTTTSNETDTNTSSTIDLNSTEPIVLDDEDVEADVDSNTTSTTNPTAAPASGVEEEL